MFNIVLSILLCAMYYSFLCIVQLIADDIAKGKEK